MKMCGWNQLAHKESVSDCQSLTGEDSARDVRDSAWMIYMMWSGHLKGISSYIYTGWLLSNVQSKIATHESISWKCS